VHSAAFPLASVSFLLSGVAALTYQVAWQRLLVLPLGADVYSMTLVVAAFMTGLGLGSLAGGHVADRLSPLRSMLLFIAAEIGIAAFGLASRGIFYDWMYLRLGRAALEPFVRATLVFAALLWPTFWMGVSLPVLGRAIAPRLGDAARRVGILYGLNTLGAAAGAFATTWLLFPRIGFDGSLIWAVGLNVSAALAVLPLVFMPGAIESAAPSISDGVSNHERVKRPGWPFAVWIALYGLAGFQALSLEIIWFRLLGVMMKASAFTFGTLLTIFLTGLGAGAALGSRLLRNVRRPGRTFLLLQAFVGLYAGASVMAIVTLLPSGEAASALRSYLGGYEPVDAAAAFRAIWSSEGHGDMGPPFLRLYVLLPALLVGPPTIAMGASFPLLQKIALVDASRIGSRVAAVLMANIAGSALGAILTGWVALTYLGSAGSIRLMMAIGGLFLAFAAAGGGATGRWNAVRGTLAFVVAAAAVVRLPDGRELWARLHGTEPNHIVQGEDATGLSVLKASGARGTVFVNGIGQSWIPYGGIHTALGALPAFVHPRPVTVAVIGLGSGDTVHAVAGRRELTRIICLEIIGPQLATLQDWERRTRNPGLTALLSDARIEHVTGDGRTYLMRSGRQFDIIEADALRPTSAFSGNVYSSGYFALVRSRLAPGGIAVTWVPTDRVLDTFRSVFPHVLHFGDIALGSETPIPFDPNAIEQRLQDPVVRSHYLRAGIDIDALLAPYLAAPGPRHIDTGPANQHDLNDDLFPRDEFSVPRAGEQ
jgi:predicted membrane-bound spermidine synthase